MKRAEQLNQMDYNFPVPRKEKRDYMDQSQETKPKRKRNSSPFSYIELISYAILSSPLKRCTLAEIYSFIQSNFPEFTENRVRWKNTVRHNLSLHECFQRAMDKAGCYWQIHPSFLVEFSQGDFSRRKLTQDPPLSSEHWSSLRENQSIMPSAIPNCHICELTRPFLVPFRSLNYQRRGMHVPYWQYPYFPHDHWMM